MAGRQDEAVAVGPRRVGGVVLHDPREEQVGDGSHRHRQPRVPGVGCLDAVHGQRADGVDAQAVDVGGGHGRVVSRAGRLRNVEPAGRVGPEEEARPAAAPRAAGSGGRRGLALTRSATWDLSLASDVVGLALRELLVAHRLVEPGLLGGHDRVLEALDVLALRLGHVGQRLAGAQLVAQRALVEAEVLGRGGGVRAEAEAAMAGRAARPAEVAQLHVRVDDVVDVRLQAVVDVVGLALRELLVGHGLVEVGLGGVEDRRLQAREVLALRLGDVGQRLAVAQLGAQVALAEAEVLGRGGELVADGLACRSRGQPEPPGPPGPARPEAVAEARARRGRRCRPRCAS